MRITQEGRSEMVVGKEHGEQGLRKFDFQIKEPPVCIYSRADDKAAVQKKK